MRQPWNKKVWARGLGLGYVLLAVLAVAASAKALDPNTKDAAQIFKAMQDNDRGDKQIAKITLTLIDSAGRKRERVLQGQMLKFKGGTKQLMLFESPADLRNTGFLSIDYDDSAKDDDQWLYLPALHKSTRIASKDKSGSFLGSDISYSDLATKKDPAAYDHKLVNFSEKVDADDCWVIESTPKTAKEKSETGYVKIQSWISKQTLLPLQHKIWVTKGNRLKYIKNTEVKKIDGIWLPMKMTVRTMKDEKSVESTTIWVFNSVKFNQASVKETEFTQSRLEQGL
jgi:outer membrane lipoprotein-sorting protein